MLGEWRGGGVVSGGCGQELGSGNNKHGVKNFGVAIVGANMGMGGGT